MKLKKSDLVKAAKELNKVLGCDPQINIKADVEGIKKDLLEAAALIEPQDKITKETLDVVTELKRVSMGKKEGAPSPDENAKPEATDEKTENNDSAMADAGDKVTKKSIVLELLKSKKGATIEQMAQAIVDRGIDTDYDKNCRIVKAYLQKMGFDTKKASIEANPIFKEV